MEKDLFAPVRSNRLLDVLVMCPTCRSGVDVTVETLRARVETISLLWDAFCERGGDIELDLEQLRNELELAALQRVRGTSPLADFCEKESTARASPILEAEPHRREGNADGLS